jgi:hypothetical protein
MELMFPSNRVLFMHRIPGKDLFPQIMQTGSLPVRTRTKLVISRKGVHYFFIEFNKLYLRANSLYVFFEAIGLHREYSVSLLIYAMPSFKKALRKKNLNINI